MEGSSPEINLKVRLLLLIEDRNNWIIQLMSNLATLNLHKEKHLQYLAAPRFSTAGVSAAFPFPARSPRDSGDNSNQTPAGETGLFVSSTQHCLVCNNDQQITSTMCASKPLHACVRMYLFTLPGSEFRGHSPPLSPHIHLAARLLARPPAKPPTHARTHTYTLVQTNASFIRRVLWSVYGKEENNPESEHIVSHLIGSLTSMDWNSILLLR